MSENDDLIQVAKDLLGSAARILQEIPEDDERRIAIAAALAEAGTGYAVLASGHAIARQVHGVRDALAAQKES
jgi:hypothetical protein